MDVPRQKSAEPNEAISSHLNSPPPNPSAAIQILDLHTSNPLISYQSRLYTCSWSTTLGTDLLFTSLPTPNSSLLAATRVKLSARPVRLIPHHGAPKHSLPSRNEEQTKKIAAKPPSTESASPTNQPPAFKIHLETHATLARQNQAQFLERLVASKAAKGEKDNVTIYAKKRFMGTGWRARRRFHELMEARDGDESDGEEETEDADGEKGRYGENYDEEQDDDEDEVDEEESDDEDDDDDDGEDEDEDDDNDDDDDDEDNDDDNDDSNETDPDPDPDPTSSIPQTVPTPTSSAPPLKARIGRPKGRRRRRIEGGGLFRDYRLVRKMPKRDSLFRNYGSLVTPANAASEPPPEGWDQLDPGLEQSVPSSVSFAVASTAEGANVSREEGGGDVVMEDV